MRRATASWTVVAFALGGAAPEFACSDHAQRTSFEDEPAPGSHVPATPVAIPAYPMPIDGACDNPDCGAAQRFVIIGDYGLSGGNEANVAALVARLHPDFVVTTGDNNYPWGEAETIDENIGRYFHSFIAPYHGRFGRGARQNRFFPSLGNHDWYSLDAQPYLDFFSLPNNERYYQVVLGNVQLFALDSDPAEPDGTTSDSIQARWLQAELGASQVPWKIVFFHHPPYSSALIHGSSIGMRWPFAEWGASIVYSGHDHTYERLAVDGFPYIVNGVGGADLYDLGEPLPESLVRHADVHGLVLVSATATELVSRFIDARGQELDVLSLRSSGK